MTRKKLAYNEKSFNRLDQYNIRNNLEIQGIPSTVGDEVLEDKAVRTFECPNIPLAKSDIEECPRLCKSNLKNTIVRFFNRKNCYASLSKKMDLRQLDLQGKMWFPRSLFFQKLEWKCRELKHEGKINSTWSS